jgi:hypothetical protein
MRSTRTQREMEEQLEQLEPGSERYQILAAAKRFKATWVELGDCLTRVREQDLYSDWGHNSLEAYCRKELHINKETVNKLTRSYAYVRDHEPRVLDQENYQEVPALDVVDLLSQAREKSTIAQSELDNIRTEVFTPGPLDVSKGALLKRFREVDPNAFRPPAPAALSPEQQFRKALVLAEKLSGLLQVQDIPASVQEKAVAVKEYLRNQMQN